VTALALAVMLLLQVLAPSLQGVVFKAGTAEPVARATVELRSTDSSDSRVRTVLTTNEGRFSFNGVPGGQYQVSVNRLGYVSAKYGERRAGGQGTPITIPAASEIQVALTATAVISGRIIDSQGQPLGNATVTASRRSFLQGRQSLAEVQSVVTNDLGDYRLFGMTPGTYYVSANAAPRGVGLGSGTDSLLVFRMYRESARTQAVPTEEIHVPIYYPGTADSVAAAPIELKPAGEVRGIDIIATPIRAHHIRGLVTTNEPGQSVTGEVQLRLAGDSAIRFTSSPTPTFDLQRVTRGKYVVVATSGTMSGRASVEVFNTDINNTTIVVGNSLNIPGRVVVEGASVENPGPDVRTLRVVVRADPEDGTILTSPPPAADGSFMLQSVPLGKYRVRFGTVLANGYIKSIRLGNSEGLDTGITVQGPSELTIVVSAKPGTVQGRVLNERGESIPNIMTVLVPDNDLRTRTDLFRNAATSVSGEFRFQGLTPGNYKLFAWEEVESGAWLNSEFMRRYEERGSAVVVSEGEIQQVQLRVIQE